MRGNQDNKFYIKHNFFKKNKDFNFFSLYLLPSFRVRRGYIYKPVSPMYNSKVYSSSEIFKKGERHQKPSFSSNHITLKDKGIRKNLIIPMLMTKL